LSDTGLSGMVKIIKAGKSIRVNKGVLLYIKHDKSVRAELVEQEQVVFISPDDYICVIFITEEVKKWRPE
jgi:hypothetical protein